MPTFTQAFVTCVFLVVVVLLIKVFRQSAVSLIRGPPSSSWLLGHEKTLVAQDQVGDTEFSWFREYGSTLRIKDCFGVNRLMTADAKALQHILHTSGYRYPKTEDVNHANLLMAGNSIGTVGGATHQRHRKVLSPAFSSGQLRTFISLFQRLSSKAMARNKETLKENGEVMDVHEWLGRLCLDIIGESAFGYNFGVINDESNDLAYQLNHLFSESIDPPTGAIIYAALWRRLPAWFMNFINFQGEQGARFLRFQNTSKRIGRDILTAASSGNPDKLNVDSDGKDGKDILSILVRVNAETDEKRRLDEDEVLSQFGAMMIAGHETATSTLSWVLHELSRRPKQQNRIRKEIAEVRARREALTPQDYDSMSFMNAVIKEGLRLHPILPSMSRQAQQDDVVPLSEPVITKTGAKLTEIPVEKGQTVRISIAYYNRNPAVWGTDADQWNPDRFLEGRGAGNSEKVSVGVYANVLTFSAGIRNCLGWRYSVMEMQTILTDLMESFRFAPCEGIQVRRAVGGIMMPIVRGKEGEGTQMPLHVTAFN